MTFERILNRGADAGEHLSKVAIAKADFFSTARGLGPRIGFLLAAAGCFLLLAWFAPTAFAQQIGIYAASGFLVLGVVIRLLVLMDQARQDRQVKSLQRLVGKDATPCFTTDEIGQIRFQNQAAQDRFGGAEGATLIATLHDHFTSPASVLFRLQSRARNLGSAREDVVTRRGHTRLSVHMVDPHRFLWRLEEFMDRSQSARGAEGLSLPMIITNKTGIVLFSNEAMRRLLGQRPKRLDQILASPSQRSGEEVEVHSVDGPVRAILAQVDGLGERREIYLFPVRNDHEPTNMLADFEHVPVSLIKFRADGVMWAANRAARDMVSLAKDEQPPIHELFEGMGRSISDWMEDVLNERLPGGTEVLRLRRSEEDVFLQVNLRRIVEAGRPGVLAVLQDATAFKTLEAQFAQSQKMQAIGQLAGGIAHDFNNLLTAISGHCDLLLLRHDQTDPEYGDLVQIHQNANRAASLVGQLLAFSRKQTLKPERLDLEDVLSDMTHLLNRLVGERVQLRLSHPDELGPIRADKRQFEQVLMNLVVNARDAMPGGGTISIETESVTLTDELRRDQAILPAGTYSLIRVMDTGTGIPPERLPKIFEPFFTTKGVGQGTGLGLSTVYGIVKQSGGFVFVDSVVGEGTIFTLYFPVYKGSPDRLQSPPQSPHFPRTAAGEGVVLLVEDEAPVRAFASRALRLRGYTVLEAENAEEALKTLEDKTLEVDVFVTDVVMPGMDGPSWVRRALDDRPGVRVVFVSGYAEDCLSDSQARIPNSVFLPKPFSLNDLTAVVQQQLIH
jgi:two-component system, cell cycle sensor histidine kinase and response regulator CckA